MTWRRFCVFVSLLSMACGGGSGSADSGLDAALDANLADTGTDAFVVLDAGLDAPPDDAGTDAPEGPSCLDTHEAGDEIIDADHCNVCTCQEDGSFACTDRVCPETLLGGCDYDGTTHDYGARFPATDGCNECVCAASGLACTRRECSEAEEGAILLEALDQPCGREGFTAQSVLQGIPYTELTAPFVYQRDGTLYPETLPDTELTLRLQYVGGFLVCRIPSEDQVAMDLEIAARWQTADGAFDEVLHAYLRRNDFGFVDAWTTVASRQHDVLVGTYTPDCLDPGSLSFAAQVNADGSASATIAKTCEIDIGLTVGEATRDPS
ncbi:MAG: hypothetical protein H6724_08835 [Sandaracinus sp.]|nr:hypothetical protein [Sandaracinus sp.]MCB9619539.1 hypothetical protein [Sandaracinus sp.]